MSFSVFINSQYAVNTAVSPALRDYDIDWSSFDEGEYELSFSFETDFQVEDAWGLGYLPHAISLPDLPLKNVISPLGRGSNSSSVIGLTSFQTLGQMATDPKRVSNSATQTNKPVICNRPSSQQFRVRFIGYTGNELTIFSVPYTLMLYFKKL